MLVRHWIRDVLLRAPDPIRRRAFNAALRMGATNSVLHGYAHLGAPTHVHAGPFAGMKYQFHATSTSQLLPKLIGTYEAEIHEFIERLVGMQPDLIIDIGAADGYYAVGLARRLPQARSVGFDTDAASHGQLRANARANGVQDRVEARGTCTTAELEKLLAGAAHPAVVSDCEGFEGDLLDPEAAPSLRRAIVLVELHEAKRPGVTDRIRAAFERSHVIDAEPTRRRSVADWPADLPRPDERIMRFALDEKRGSPQQWFLLTPRAGDGSSGEPLWRGTGNGA